MLIKEKKEHTLINIISEQFLNGLIVLVPPAITIFVVMWLLDLTEGTIEPYLPIKFPGVGLITILLSIWLVGAVSGHNIPQKIIELAEYLLGKIPVVKFIYTSVKQFSQAVFDSRSSFESVVLAPYNQTLVMGFLMKHIPDEIQKKLGDEYVCVFVPFSMNMTAGFNFFVKNSEVIPLNMEMEDGLQFILTAGTVSKNAQKDLPKNN